MTLSLWRQPQLVENVVPINVLSFLNVTAIGRLHRIEKNFPITLLRYVEPTYQLGEIKNNLSTKVFITMALSQRVILTFLMNPKNRR